MKAKSGRGSRKCKEQTQIETKTEGYEDGQESEERERERKNDW